jgi:hypothetical protein
MFQFLRGVALIAAIMLNCKVAGAAFDPSANGRMPGCRGFLAKTGQNFLDQGYCAGLIDGIIFGATNLCAPQTGTLDQALRVVVQYIDGRPARMHEDFRVLSIEALLAAWPCKK